MKCLSLSKLRCSLYSLPRRIQSSIIARKKCRHHRKQLTKIKNHQASVLTGFSLTTDQQFMYLGTIILEYLTTEELRLQARPGLKRTICFFWTQYYFFYA
ncbi:hypothetical protein FKM82_001365 [Ascaphus truei]